VLQTKVIHQKTKVNFWTNNLNVLNKHANDVQTITQIRILLILYQNMYKTDLIFVSEITFEIETCLYHVKYLKNVYTPV